MSIAVEPNPTSLGSTCSPSAALITATRKLVTSGTAVQACTGEDMHQYASLELQGSVKQVARLELHIQLLQGSHLAIHIIFSTCVPYIALQMSHQIAHSCSVSPTRAVLQALACRCQITSVPVRQDAYRPSSTSSDTAVGHCLHQCIKYRS